MAPSVLRATCRSVPILGNFASADNHTQKAAMPFRRAGCSSVPAPSACPTRPSQCPSAIRFQLPSTLHVWSLKLRVNPAGKPFCNNKTAEIDPRSLFDFQPSVSLKVYFHAPAAIFCCSLNWCTLAVTLPDSNFYSTCSDLLRSWSRLVAYQTSASSIFKSKFLIQPIFLLASCLLYFALFITRLVAESPGNYLLTNIFY